MKIPSKQYDSIFDDYNRAVSWITSLGLDTTKGRLLKYHNVLNDLIENYKSGNGDKLNEIFPDVMSSAYEATWLVDIFKGLNVVPDANIDHIKKKLELAIYGPEYQQNENNKNNTARNYQFELLVESILNKPELGLQVDFKSSSDTAVKFLQKKYFFECKRLQSFNQLEKNIRDAIKQLEKQLKNKNGSNLRGIIALDFSKAFNPDFKMLSKSNDMELYKYVEQTVRILIDKYSHTWQKILSQKNNKIIAVIVRLSFMAISESRNLIVTCSQWGINPKKNISNFENLYLEELNKALNIKQ